MCQLPYVAVTLCASRVQPFNVTVVLCIYSVTILLCYYTVVLLYCCVDTKPLCEIFLLYGKVFKGTLNVDFGVGKGNRIPLWQPLPMLDMLRI